MATTPLSLDEWQTRLAGISSTPFHEVGQVADLPEMDDLASLTGPSLYVMAASDTATPDAGTSGGTHQEAEGLVSVLYMVPQWQGQRDIQSLRAVVWARLIGWTPTDACFSAEFVRGRAVGFANKVLLWDDTFKARYWIRS